MTDPPTNAMRMVRAGFSSAMSGPRHPKLLVSRPDGRCALRRNRNCGKRRPSGGTMQKGNVERFGRRNEPGNPRQDTRMHDTTAPRAGLEGGHGTRKGWALFRVRQQFADERQDHRTLILPVDREPLGWTLHVLCNAAE